MAKAKSMTKGSAAKASSRAKARSGELPIISFADLEAWCSWLSANHAASAGVWLKIAKTGSEKASITYAEALKGALMWGWIDGQKGKLDETWWLQKFTRRAPRSPWSKINREKALALIAAGEMKPAGLAEVERAKRDGRWEAAYDGQSRAVVPDDFQAALAANAKAAAFFGTLDARNRYAVLYRIHTAKKPETRLKRIEQFVAMLAKHEKLHA